MHTWVVEVKGYKIRPYANLQGADLSDANLETADLSRANLRVAVLHLDMEGFSSELSQLRVSSFSVTGTTN